MNFELTEKHIVALGADGDSLQQAAAHICERCRDQLPDLSEITILMPALQAAALLQAALLDKAEQLGYEALLLPRMMTLQQFAAQHAQPVMQRVLSTTERVLILVNELRHHPTLYGNGSPWLLAENLLHLFDELVLNQIDLPESSERFVEQLAQAYRVSTDNPSLQREARLVLTLWQAWQKQLHDEQLIDPTQYYLQQLSSSLENISGDKPIFMLGWLDLCKAEQQWLNKLAANAELTVLRTGNGMPAQVLPELGLCTSNQTSEKPLSVFLNACYNWQQNNLQQRINDFKSQLTQSPVANTLHILGVDNFEQQAQASALFIRAALANHDQRIGIVCEDRLMARRIRALLERSQIFLHDAVGWALSTTRAATVLESWLECIELDFPHHAFLDLLKSPLMIESENDPLLKLIYRFENDIVLHENIGSGLDRYANAIEFRSRRLQHWTDQTRTDLLALLQQFRRTAESLLPLLNHRFNTVTALELLITSLQQLSRTTFFQTDAAADSILQTLLKLQQAAEKQSIPINWPELRDWIGRKLETEYFRPESDAHHNVILLGLQQSYLQSFDSLIIAAADEQHLPGNSTHLPFFNQSVRAALGLPDRSKELRIKETIFRQLLQNSRSTLLLWQKQVKGEPVSASHWVSTLELFHRQVYGETLEPQALKQWLQQPQLIPSETDDSVPVTMPQQPKPSVGPLDVPTELSVSAHQRLINCPYQFYIQDILHLEPLDEVREALQKSDYGNLVHTCLEAFHIGINKLHGPFKQTIDANNRDQAIQTLSKISQQIFFRDIEDNFQHRGWLQRWLEFIPDYIDWQIQHAVEWQIVEGEKRGDVTLAEHVSLRGRIDRVEKKNATINLIDYKTGVLPKPDDILSGEEVQLVSYSLLLEHVSSVQYIGVDGRNGVNDKNTVADEELKTLQKAVKDRLIDLMQRIRNNEPLPAHGDEITCSYCDARGVCRRDAWK
ncbi:MAG: PD-(D/E)XK nuclease family protein [Gammaproteobacteria bacterium]|nr:PD-(D/E)XK nuclease family protein [Gammaproteobacteria bacterium]